MTDNVDEVKQENRFDDFFVDPIYLRFKKDLWNYRVRHELINQVLSHFPGGATLEVGAGVAPMVPPLADSVYTDLSPEAITFLKKQYPRCESKVSQAGDLPFSDQSFSCVVSSEVLEHIADDRLALKEMHRVLASEGKLVLTVPTHAYLFTIDDHFVEHQRRYNSRELKMMLSECGFNNIEIKPATGLLDKLAWIVAILTYKVFSFLKRKKNDSKNESKPSRLGFVLPFYRFFNGIYAFFVKLEARIIPMSLASSVLIVAQKGRQDA